MPYLMPHAAQAGSSSAKCCSQRGKYASACHGRAHADLRRRIVHDAVHSTPGPLPNVQLIWRRHINANIRAGSTFVPRSMIAAMTTRWRSNN